MIVLNPITFLSNITVSGATNWIPVTDSRFSEERTRSLFGTRTDADCPITVMAKISVPTFDPNGVRTSPVEVTATVTTFTSANGAYFNTNVPFAATHLQVIKVNSSGAATVVGLI